MTIEQETEIHRAELLAKRGLLFGDLDNSTSKGTRGGSLFGTTKRIRANNHRYSGTLNLAQATPVNDKEALRKARHCEELWRYFSELGDLGLLWNDWGYDEIDEHRQLQGIAPRLLGGVPMHRLPRDYDQILAANSSQNFSNSIEGHQRCFSNARS
jgi:hypothetical protein